MSAPPVHAVEGATTSPWPADSGTNTPEGVADGNGPSEPVSQAARTGVAARSAHRLGYEHLAPLFVERCGLPEGDPRRKRLRDLCFVPIGWTGSSKALVEVLLLLLGFAKLGCLILWIRATFCVNPREVLGE